MAQNVVINGVTYQNVPEVNIPKSGGGTAKFFDTADADGQHTAPDTLKLAERLTADKKELLLGSRDFSRYYYYY